MHPHLWKYTHPWNHLPQNLDVPHSAAGPTVRGFWYIKDTPQSSCSYTCQICRRNENFLFYTYSSVSPCKTCTPPRSEKQSRFTQLPMKALKCFRIGKTLSLQLCCLSPITVCSSVYGMHMGLFRIIKLCNPVLTVAQWKSLTRLTSSVFIHHGVNFHAGTSYSLDGICIHCIILFSVTYNRNDALTIAER